MTETHQITTIEQLEALYGEPEPLALKKEIDHISAHYQAFIEKSPFVVVATSGLEGLDCSPKGDPAGFVRVVDENTVLIPDRRGNNRVDSLRNIVCDGRISLLFLIPGVKEALRINGRAVLSVDPELCASFPMQGKVPTSVIVVTAERVYFHCPKALMRSKLWDADAQIERSELPSSGEIFAALDKDFDGAELDRIYPKLVKDGMY
jgi:PPOX class probable FMN-dependent enzyme